MYQEAGQESQALPLSVSLPRGVRDGRYRAPRLLQSSSVQVRRESCSQSQPLVSVNTCCVAGLRLCLGAGGGVSEATPPVSRSRISFTVQGDSDSSVSPGSRCPVPGYINPSLSSLQDLHFKITRQAQSPRPGWARSEEGSQPPSTFPNRAPRVVEGLHHCSPIIKLFCCYFATVIL